MLARPKLRPLVANAITIRATASHALSSSSSSPPPLLQQHQHQHQQSLLFRHQHRPASSITAAAAVAATTATPKVIFSGIQPTGVPHLGNYLGALKQWVHLQNTAEPGTKLLFSVVDLHAITAPGDDPAGQDLRQRRRETLAALMAIGLDPDRCILFYQSSVCFFVSSASSFVVIAIFARGRQSFGGERKKKKREFGEGGVIEGCGIRICEATMMG